MKGKNIAILGTVGVPANYGGFETLDENLVRYHDAASLPDRLGQSITPTVCLLSSIGRARQFQQIIAT